MSDRQIFEYINDIRKILDQMEKEMTDKVTAEPAPEPASFVDVSSITLESDKQRLDVIGQVIKIFPQKSWKHAVSGINYMVQIQLKDVDTPKFIYVKFWDHKETDMKFAEGNTIRLTSVKVGVYQNFPNLNFDRKYSKVQVL